MKAIPVLAGLVSAAVTAGLVALIRLVFGYDVFSFWIWGMFPLGPLICGTLAGMGLYAACIQWRVRPNALVLLTSLILGSLTYLMAHWLWFRAIRDELGSDLGFARFLSRAVTRVDLSLDVSHWAVNVGPVEELGYLFAAINFIAVSLGGGAAFRLLKERPWCERCGGYFRTVGESKKAYFETPAAYHSYREQVPMAASRVGELRPLMARRSEQRIDREGVYYIESTLRRCPGCRRQMLQEWVQEYRDGWWRLVGEDERNVEVPPENDLGSLFGPDESADAAR